MSSMKAKGSLLIKNGRIVDPFNNIDSQKDILIQDGLINKIGKISDAQVGNAEVIDAAGLVVSPSFVDLHTHVREPGREDEETLESAAKAAAAGGFTVITAMPNTEPAVDNASVVNFLAEKAKNLPVDLKIAGAMTKNLQGNVMAGMGEMALAGAVFFTDDGKCVQSANLTRKVMEYANGLGKFLMIHSEDESLSKDSQMNESKVSTMLGLKGCPVAAESVIVSRDIRLAALTGCKVHFTHVSCKESVDFIRQAKNDGLPVTCDTTPHHIFFTDEELYGYNTNLKVNPPIRSERDRDALIEGLIDGTINAIATDHAPHAEQEKECEFEYAAFGTIGLETALAACLTSLHDSGKMELANIVGKLTTQPANILGLKERGIAEENNADIVIFDPSKKWIFSRSDIYSKSKNSAFIGKQLKGQVIYTIYNGKKVFARENVE